MADVAQHKPAASASPEPKEGPVGVIDLLINETLRFIVKCSSLATKRLITMLCVE